MQVQPAIWVIGILAGVVGGAMVVAGLAFRAVTLLLAFAAPAAVYVAALGWGPVAGFVAAIVATGVVAYFTNLIGLLATATLWFLPAAWAGHLANLAQPAPDGEGLIWYPLSRILMWLMLTLAAGFVILGSAAGYHAAEIADEVAKSMLRFASDGSQPEQVNAELIDQIARLYATLIPLVVPASWLFMHVAVFHVSASVMRQAGRLARPRDDIAATVTLPVNALIMPIAGLVGMLFLDSPLYEVAAVVAGIGIAGFGLIGLAELHLVTRGRPGRGTMLFLTYFLIFMFSIPFLFFAVWGAVRAARRQQAAPPQPPARRN